MTYSTTQIQMTVEDGQMEVAKVRITQQEQSREGGEDSAPLEEPASTSALALLPGVTSPGGGTITPLCLLREEPACVRAVPGKP